MSKIWAIYWSIIFTSILIFNGFQPSFQRFVFDQDRWNKTVTVEKSKGNSNYQESEHLFKTVTVTPLKSLGRNVAVVTSSDMLISQIIITTFYNDLINYEDENYMSSGTKACIGQAKTYCITQLSWSNMAATAILKCKISIGS